MILVTTVQFAFYAYLRDNPSMNKFVNFREICGLIGGVGPSATNYLFGLIINMNNVRKDQDHIPLLIFNNPQIPDRTQHLVYAKKSPLPELILTAKVLKKAGATFLAIPCNAAHPYILDIEREVGIKVLNMVPLVAEHIFNLYGRNIKIGILATDGTIKSNIYLNEIGAGKVLIPDSRGQKNVMEAIYGKRGIKASFLDTNNFEILYSEAKRLIDRGADVVIEGCTEIPLVLSQGKCNFPVIDPMEILAKKIIEITINSKI
ncbi:MAG: aspartate racemase [Candidatus Levybacteria bacterium CG_4_10_14_0_2_um_filter_35_8]|nr:MAG: aspartate racemase [Candidatus Levybacteria bacterium CG_4_10_14_0_2_um_filter_35_8]PJC54324.1 MAG: aspartate racemase [Candidatus Levybacteria bacterium CG_4_9_14_0_2_um_filter_35_21]